MSGVENDGCADEILDETMRELGEISLPESRDVEREATLTRTKFDKFVKSFFQTKNSQLHTRPPLTEPLLAKKHELDRTVSLNELGSSGVVGMATKRGVAEHKFG